MQDQKLRARFRSALIEPPFRTNYYDFLSVLSRRYALFPRSAMAQSIIDMVSRITMRIYGPAHSVQSPSKGPSRFTQAEYHDRDPAKPLSQSDTREFEITIHPA